MIAKRMVLIGCVGALGVAGCGGGGTGSMKLGEVASLARPGDSTKIYKTYKYKAAIVSVKQAGPNDLKGETLLGDTSKNDVAFYVTQRVTGVDPPQCVEHRPPAGFGAGQSFETCDVYLLPRSDHVGKVVLPAEGPGQNDLTWKIS